MSQIGSLRGGIVYALRISFAWCAFFGVLGGVIVTPAAGQVLHTDPLNFDPAVKDGLQHFYNLDYDGALQRFEAVERAHPQNPMALDYILTVVIFRELYHQDLLDTTYYAHDSFLTSKRYVDVPAATRQRIENLTNTVISICDQSRILRIISVARVCLCSRPASAFGALASSPD